MTLSGSYSSLHNVDRARVESFVHRRLRLRAISRPGERREILNILNDHSKFQELCAQAWHRFGQSGVQNEWLDRIGEFFQWFVENWDVIWQIIQIIIGLFGGLDADSAPTNVASIEQAAFSDDFADSVERATASACAMIP